MKSFEKVSGKVSKLFLDEQDRGKCVGDVCRVLTDYVLERSSCGDGVRMDGGMTVNEVENSGLLEVLTENGECVNDVLPSGVKITYCKNNLDSPGYSFNPDENLLYIPRKNIYQISDAVSVSCESGRALARHEDLHTEPVEIGIKVSPYFSSGVDKKKAMEGMRLFVLLLNDAVISEQLAWERGKVFSDLFGVDEVFYEDIRDNSITSCVDKCLSELVEILGENRFDVNSLLDLSEEISVYIPALQDYKEMAVGELIDMAKSSDDRGYRERLEGLISGGSHQ